MFSFFFRRDGHGASTKVLVYSKAAQQSRLDDDQKALAAASRHSETLAPTRGTLLASILVHYRM
jgi:hypothetical protein